MILSKPADRLYLQRDGVKDIFIDLPTPLPQHQLDGIRFLFQLFKKKAPGVIINDPSGYGKCLQTVLFLNAVRPMLNKPILVLSNSVNNWTEHFKIWTDCCDELAIEASNPFSKKQVFVSPVKDGVSFSRRSWGIIVLHDEHCTWDLLKLNCNADYKIWVTSNNLKENLYILASIYEWLHPNQKFNVALVTPQKNNKKDVVEKALLLDAILEDFLIRRTDFFCPFPKAETLKPSSPPPVTATRKNKDPTGTKVKRSKKRRIIDDDDDDTSNQAETTNKNNDISSNSSVSNATATKMDVESFLRDKKPIESEEFQFVQNTYKRPQDDDTGNSMDIDFTEAVNELVENEKSIHTTNKDLYGGVESPNISREEDNDATQEYLLDTIENNEVGVLVPATEEIYSWESNSTAHNDNINKYIQDDTISRNQGVVIPETESESSEKWDNTIENNQKFVIEESNDCKTEDINNKNERSSLPERSDKLESINANKSGAENDNTNSNKDVVKNKSEMDEFDAKLAEFEEQALKKFKSSILDSIF